MKRHISFSALCGVLILAASTFVLKGDTTEATKAQNPDPKKTTTFIEWVRVNNLKDLGETSFTGFLCYDNKWCTLGSNYNSQGRYQSSSWTQQDGLWYMENRKDDPYMDLEVGAGGTFVTKDTMNAPYFKFKRKDGDNYNSCVYDIQLKPCNKHLYLTSHETHFTDSEDNLTFIRNNDVHSKDSDVNIPDSTYKIFYNRSGARDTFVTTYGSAINSVGDSGWSKASYFKVFRAVLKYYSVIDWDAEIEKTFKIEDDFLLKDGYTLTIPEGCVLTVTSGTFYVNGRIDCKGTLIVQDGATIVPFSPSKGGGEIDLNGGTLIVMPGGRAMIGLGKDCLNSTSDAMCDFKAKDGRQSLIVNHGLLAIGCANINDKTTIENHKGGRLFLGYNVRKYFKKFVGVTYSSSTTASALGLETYSAHVTPSEGVVFKAYDGSNMSIGGYSDGGKKISYYYYDNKGNESHYDKLK